MVMRVTIVIFITDHVRWLIEDSLVQFIDIRWAYPLFCSDEQILTSGLDTYEDNDKVKKNERV